MLQVTKASEAEKYVVCVVHIFIDNDATDDSSRIGDAPNSLPHGTSLGQDSGLNEGAQKKPKKMSDKSQDIF